jgi:hypothetical protein
LCSQCLDELLKLSGHSDSVQSTIKSVFSDQRLYISYGIDKSLNEIKKSDNTKFKEQTKDAETATKDAIPTNVISESADITNQIRETFDININNLNKAI